MTLSHSSIQEVILATHFLLCKFLGKYKLNIAWAKGKLHLSGQKTDIFDLKPFSIQVKLVMTSQQDHHNIFNVT